MKTTVRVSAVLPDCYITIQRLHDDGLFFRLEKEVLTGDAAADFVERLQAQGGVLLETHEFIDDDDLKPKIAATFEYITE